MNLIESLGLNPGVIADVVLAAIIIWELLSGMRKGAVRMIGGLLELGGGIYAGNLLRKAHSADAARWLVPAVRDVLDAAMNKLGLTDILENLDNILDTSRLPDFLKQDVLEQVKVRVGSGTETALSGAAGVIAQRLAGLLLFLLGMIVVTIVFRIIFQAVIDPVISNVPLLDESNRFLGAVIGAAFGVLIAGLILALCYRLAPALSQDAASVFSDRSIRNSCIMRHYFRLWPGAFKG